MVHYANQSRIEGLSLKKGDRVYLLKQNIKTKRLNEKLDHKRLGPFRILWKLLDVSYELDLPKSTKLHPRFYILLLELADQLVLLLKEIYVNDPKEYEVERILDYRGTKPDYKYFVK